MVRKYASFSKTGGFWWCKGEEGRSAEWGGRTLMFVKAGDLNWVLLISSVLIYDFFLSIFLPVELEKVLFYCRMGDA